MTTRKNQTGAGVLGTGDSLVNLDPREVHVVEGRNARFDEGNIEELAESIKANSESGVRGVRNPVKVQFRDGRYDLVDGHRRHMAVLKLVEQGVRVGMGKGEVYLPAEVVPDDKNEGDILVDMLASNDGKPFLPLEEGYMYAKLQDLDLRVEEIAQRVGRSKSHVSDRLALVKAAPELQEALEAGKITTSDAVTMTRKSRGDKDLQKEMVASATKAGEGGGRQVARTLTKGRLPRVVWGHAEEAYQAYQAALHHPGLEDEAVEWKAAIMDVEDREELFAEHPELEMVFRMGEMAAAADQANIDFDDMIQRLHGRTSGKQVSEAKRPEQPKEEAVSEAPKTTRRRRTTRRKAGGGGGEEQSAATG